MDVRRRRPNLECEVGRNSRQPDATEDDTDKEVVPHRLIVAVCDGAPVQA